MATDFVQLFDERLSAQLLALDQPGLEDLVSRRWERLANSCLQYSYQGGTLTSSHIRHLLQSEYTVLSLQKQLILDLCFISRMLYVDYWACYAEVFMTNPEGFNLLQGLVRDDEEEETFVLLRPEHVDRMLSSLRDHHAVMGLADIAELKSWTDQCRADMDK